VPREGATSWPTPLNRPPRAPLAVASASRSSNRRGHGPKLPHEATCLARFNSIIGASNGSLARLSHLGPTPIRLMRSLDPWHSREVQEPTFQSDGGLTQAIGLSSMVRCPCAREAFTARNRWTE
jgi:hypothetical protein